MMEEAIHHGSGGEFRGSLLEREVALSFLVSHGRPCAQPGLCLADGRRHFRGPLSVGKVGGAGLGRARVLEGHRGV